MFSLKLETWKRLKLLRNFVYTSIARAKKICIIVNNKTIRPYFQNKTTMKYLRRIDKWMVMMAIVCVAFLTGCGKSAKDGESASGESKDNKEVVTESAEAQDESESADVDEDLPEGLDSMTSGLAETPITVSPKGAKANIQDFAQAFCSQYDRFEPNEKILKYIAAPKSYDEHEELYRVESDITNGYIRSMLLTEVARETQMCYWNRKNGHSLVGVFMANGSENSKSENVFMFYDYDPKTNIMTPDLNVYKVVEKVALDKAFEEYLLELPREGKDIVVDLYTPNGEDGYDVTEKTLKWTGDTFTLVAD
jgi:hypothetical protein